MRLGSSSVCLDNSWCRTHRIFSVASAWC
jgi:hypothetical protein